MGVVGRGLRKPVVIVALVVGLVAAGAGLYWFQPWRLWVDETVSDTAPDAARSPSAAPKDQDRASKGPKEPSGPSGPKTLAVGTLISHEHETSGSVRILRLADGDRVLRLEKLATSSGPDLRVWITDAPVKRGEAGWHVFDDGKYVSLGKLKGNRGDQNYALPADLDLNAYRSVSIWCDRFDVSFGAAELSRDA